MAWALIAVWAAFGAFVLHDPEAAVSTLTGGVAGSLTAFFVVPFIVRARARNLARKHQTEVALRVLDGHQSGLGPRWRHGVATLAPGRLTFRGTVGGVRFLRRRPITVEVLEVDRGSARTTGLREAWWAWPGTEVAQLVTPTARLEWAVPATRMEWATGELLPTRDAAGGS